MKMERRIRCLGVGSLARRTLQSGLDEPDAKIAEIELNLMFHFALQIFGGDGGVHHSITPHQLDQEIAILESHHLACPETPVQENEQTQKKSNQ